MLHAESEDSRVLVAAGSAKIRELKRFRLHDHVDASGSEMLISDIPGARPAQARHPENRCLLCRHSAQESSVVP